jgi:hypothetical protein
MLRSLLRDLSRFRSWLAVVLDNSHKLFPGRLVGCQLNHLTFIRAVYLLETA